MNRVRIVAITAVALGGAVVAGTHFQQQTGAQGALPAAQAPAVQVPQGVATPSLAVLAPSAAPDAPNPRQDAPLRDTDTPVVAAASVLPQVDLSRPPLPEVNADALAPRIAQLAPEAASSDMPPAVPLDAELQAELNACAVWLVVTPTEGAILETSVYAPCDRDARVTLSHAGLSFDTVIGSDGQLMAFIPALREEAEVTLSFDDGRAQSDSTLVPDLGTIERVALHWQGPATLSLHAYEFGAQYGQPGHVHAGTPPAAEATARGHVIALGDATLAGSRLAQVYSFPRGTSPQQGQVTLEIEVPVTEASCGSALEVDTIEVHGATTAQLRRIQLDMPPCDGNGGYLVLPGILPELQIAMN